MEMHNPMHPGEFIQETYLDELGISQATLAAQLKVDKSTVSRLLAGTLGVSPEMALRLSTVLGRTPESWLVMQNRFDLFNT
jgi:addiction module HigA family antidote